MSICKDGSLFLLILAISSVTLNAYKLLIISPRFGRSHVLFLGNIADLLVAAGHDVTVFSPEMDFRVPTNGTKLAKTVGLPPYPPVQSYLNDTSMMDNAWMGTMQTPSFYLLDGILRKFFKFFVLQCEYVLSQSTLIKQLKAEKFDLALAEPLDGCSFGIIKLLKIPTHIMVSPTTLNDYIAEKLGVPIIPSFVPAGFSTFTEQMTYFERGCNLFSTLLVRRFFLPPVLAAEQELFDRLYQKDNINLEEIFAQTALVFVNSNPFFDYPKPTISKVIDIGGVSVPQIEPLNEYWTKVMGLREKTILISFGSYIKTSAMPQKMKRALLKTFDQFTDITFIWKYELEEDRIADGHPNLVTSKWVPQSDLLAHPNLTAFVTHGGMNSITEIVHRGKPAIVVPIFGDQMRNAQLVERAGLGIQISVLDLPTDGMLSKAIQRMLNDTSFAENAKRLSRMTRQQPNSPKKQLIKYVEFAARFGEIAQLKPYGTKLSFITYYMLDIIIPFLLITISTIFAILYFTFKLIRGFLIKRKSKSE